MQRRIATLAIMACLLWMGRVQAQEGSNSPPVDDSFVINIDLDAARQSRIGKKLLDAVRRQALEEYKEIGNDQQLLKALGLDPFEDIHAVSVLGSDVYHPETDLQLVVSLGTNAGNLEGLIVALPGYDFTDHGEHRIYSAFFDEGKGFGAIHTDSQGQKRVILGMSQAHVSAMLDLFDGQHSETSQQFKTGEGSYLEMRLQQFPMNEIGDEPQFANIAKLIKTVTLSIGERGEDVSLDLTLDSPDEKSAEQLRQLSQGLGAMMALSQPPEGDEEARQIVGILEKMVVTREGEQVHLQAAIPTELALQFLREQAGLQF